MPKARSAGDAPARPRRAPEGAKAGAKPAAKGAAARPRAAAKPAAKAPPKPASPLVKASAAGPDGATKSPIAARRTKREKLPPDRLEQLVQAARKSLEDDKAEDVVVLDVTGRASFADRMVIATGLAERQIQAMATHLEDALEKVGLKLRRDAIQGSPDWVLIDAGDLIVHLFKAEARETYGLERMWGPESPAADG